MTEHFNPQGNFPVGSGGTFPGGGTFQAGPPVTPYRPPVAHETQAPPQSMSNALGQPSQIAPGAGPTGAPFGSTHGNAQGYGGHAQFAQQSGVQQQPSQVYQPQMHTSLGGQPQAGAVPFGTAETGGASAVATTPTGAPVQQHGYGSNNLDASRASVQQAPLGTPASAQAVPPISRASNVNENTGPTRQSRAEYAQQMRQPGTQTTAVGASASYVPHAQSQQNGYRTVPTGQQPFGQSQPLPQSQPVEENRRGLSGATTVQPTTPTATQPSNQPRIDAQAGRRAKGVITEDQSNGGRVGMSNALRAGDLAIDELLREVVEQGASDMHLTVRSSPMIRKAGELTPLEGYEAVKGESLRRSIYAMLTQRQREKFEEVLELDFAYQVPGGSRFRVNLYQQRDNIGAAFRVIPNEIKPLEDLGVPPIVSTFAKLPRGLVLVTGPTGSGKSTTLASIIDLANRTRPDHIMTVEDPIEFLHEHKKSLVNQREVGTDTWSFAAALKHVLRQDPDIILVGEMRDLETISVALTAAETGHLVFATLHTQDAAQTIDRVIDVFPPEQQEQIRVQLASAIQGVVCQTLCKRANGPGRVVATEVMIATPGIRNLVREGKTHQIYSAMQAGKNQGMHTMDQHLADLVKSGDISYETGVDKCHHLEDFNRLAGRGGANFGTDALNGGF